MLTRRNESSPTGEVLTLARLKTGGKARVLDLGGAGINRRLVSLGIGPGTELEVVSVHPFRGPVVVRVDGAQVAIGRGLAEKIKVEEPV